VRGLLLSLVCNLLELAVALVLGFEEFILGDVDLLSDRRPDDFTDLLEGALAEDAPDLF
jgi:hypothetical protein